MIRRLVRVVVAGFCLVSLLVAFAVAYPVNRWLIARGLGHAVIHGHHGH